MTALKMKRLFLDTNFIIDYFVRPDSNEYAEKLLIFGKENGSSFYISFLTVANFAYILRKMPKQNLLSLIERICETFIVVCNTKNQINRTFLLTAPDFEDALQYETALDGNCDCIITRNQKDFTFSKIPILSAEEFLKQYDLSII